MKRIFGWNGSKHRSTSIIHEFMDKAKEEKTLSVEDQKRIEQLRVQGHTFAKTLPVYTADPMMIAQECFIAGAEYEHKYQREQQVELRNENEKLKELLKRALIMLPSNPNYGAAWDAPIRHVCDNLRSEIKEALNSLKTK